MTEAKPMVMLGYEPGGKAYRLYDPATKCVHISRDVIFDESTGLDWSNDNMAGDYDGGEFTIEYSYAPATATLPASPNQSTTVTPAPVEIQPENNSEAKPVDTAATEQTPAGTAEQVRFATPPSAPDPELFDDSNDPDHPHRYRRVLDMVEPDAPVPGQAERLLLTPSGEPSTYAEAEHDEHWHAAMLEELRSIEENKTWTLTDLPAGYKPIGLKWVFKLKRDANGNVLKHKARLVADRKSVV